MSTININTSTTLGTVSDVRLSNMSIGGLQINKLDEKIKGLHKYSVGDLVICLANGSDHGRIGKIKRAYEVVMDFDLDINTGTVTNVKMLPQYSVDFRMTEAVAGIHPNYSINAVFYNDPKYLESELELSFSV